jgi:hypothetical protein
MAALTAAAIGISALGAVQSFTQASQQKRLQAQAQQDAEKAMAEARKKLEINYMDKLSIQKEPYELQREAALIQGAEAIQAGREQERGAAATAGRVQLAQNEMQGDIRTGMQKEMSDLEKLKAQEDSRLRDVGVQLDLEEVAGNQQMAADAQQAAAAATAQGWQGVTSAAQQGIQMAELYPGAGKGGDTAKTTAPATSATTATPSKMTTQVPSSKLNVSSFQKAPTASQLAQSNLDNSTFKYGQGSKFGSPIKMPLWSDAYNYFKYF